MQEVFTDQSDILISQECQMFKLHFYMGEMPTCYANIQLLFGYPDVVLMLVHRKIAPVFYTPAKTPTFPFAP
jgi:hypothetical protein